MTVKDAENIKLAGCLLPMRRHGKGVLPDVTAATRDRRGNHPRDACAGWAAEGQRYGGPYCPKGREDPSEAARERPENSGGGTGVDIVSR